MKRYKLAMLGLLSVMLLTGCVPEQRIIWSPDGERAIVLGEEQDGARTLYLCDADGVLSAPQCEGVFRAAWRPDSTGIMMARMTIVTNWTEAEHLLPAPEKAELIRLAEALYQNLARDNISKDSIKASMGKINLTDNQLDWIALYLDYRGAELKIGSLSATLWSIETTTVGNHSMNLDDVVSRTIHPVWELRVSPNGQLVAYAAETGEEQWSLYVAALETIAAPRLVDTNVAMYPDWSADGQSIIYAVGNNPNAAGNDMVQLGAIARSIVADSDGGLLREFNRKDLVGIIMHEFTRVRALSDGGIVFSALDVQLPAMAGDMPEQMILFKMNPEQQATVSRLLPRRVEHYLGEWSTFFELSPDGKRMVFPDANQRIAVVTLASGEFRHISVDCVGEQADYRIDSLPSWKSNDAFSLVQSFKHAEKDGWNAAVAIRAQGINTVPRIISTNWPAALTKSLTD